MFLNILITRLIILMSVPGPTVPEIHSFNDMPGVNEKYLIITADDFGACCNINEGIRLAADNNSITAISAMTNFTPSLPELMSISRSHPEIGIGVHLNITTGKPLLPVKEIPTLVNSDGNFYSIEEILPNIKKISYSDLEKELRAQIIILNKYGIKPDHLSDQNGILTIYSPFFDIITKLADEFNLPMRSAVPCGIKYPRIFRRSCMQRRARNISLRFALKYPFKAFGLLKYCRINKIMEKSCEMDKLDIVHPDLLIEYFWGDPTAENFLYILDHLQCGISELMVHLGTGSRQDDYPSGLDQDYFKNREKELSTITGSNLKEYYKNSGIKIIGYRNISECRKN